MHNLTRRGFVIAGGATLMLPVRAVAKAPEIYIDGGGVFGKAWTHAVGGYDTVAYHSLSPNDAPVMGLEDYRTDYRGASWVFRSQENLNAFKADPDRYRPQYGGYCAWAMARNKLAKGDPAVWHIENGKLYLNVSVRYKREWLEHIERDIARADANWPAILERN